MISWHDEAPHSPPPSSAPEAQDQRLIEAAADFFSTTGPLSRSKDFEHRPEQARMASAIASAISQHEPLLIEAGTGVGKSLAYLVPTLFHALQHGRKALISTHTINLQEQLIHKDIPLLQKLLKRPFQAELLKGRHNYLCPHRLDQALRSATGLFTSPEYQELQRLQDWSQTTEDGSLSDLDFSPTPSLWAQVCSEAHLCTLRRCGQNPRCHYQRAKKRAESADLLVMNHTLFFTLLASQGATEDPSTSGREPTGQAQSGRELAGQANLPGFLYPGDFVILDEAHTLENVAARQLGLRLSYQGLLLDLNRLHHRKLGRGYFSLLKDSPGTRATQHCHDAIDEFFHSIHRHCPAEQKEHRLRTPPSADLQHHTAAPLGHLRERILEASERTDKESLQLELREMARRISLASHSIEDFMDHRLEDHVYWIERQSTMPRSEGQSPNHLTLQSAPIAMNEALHEIFFQQKRSAIFTSATLSTAPDNLDYFQTRLGASLGQQPALAHQIGSPFDYPQQMTLHLCKGMPESNHQDYQKHLLTHLIHFLKKTQGRAFILFTSYSLLKSMATALAPTAREQGWRLLAQGQDGPRHQMLETFKSHPHAVLLGTDSYWTGVDVPGEKLQNVLITKLPFAVPTHPYTQSQLERLEEQGQNPFRHYSIPEAILKLRQGVGRLIRSKKDQGIIVILDSRILTKSYGKQFLNALPECPRVIHEALPMD